MTRGANRQVILRKRPVGLPSVDDFAMSEKETQGPCDGEVLLQTLFVSIDPAMRGWVAEAQNYVQPVPVGSVMRSFGVGRVVESRSRLFSEGDILVGLTGWQEWAVVADGDILFRVDTTRAPLSTALGVVGLTGLTAYVGMMTICRPEPSSTVLVSSAAGSVGSAAAQLARLAGARVVGLTGSEEKQTLCLNAFALDHCINYRAEADLSAAIGKACPTGVDAYFDCVGGEMLDAALDNLNVGGRIAICGTIGHAAGATPIGPRPERRLLVQRATMQGFLATDHLAESQQILDTLAGYVRNGQLRYLEEIAASLEDAPKALTQVLQGANIGKALVRVAAESVA